MNMNTLQPKPLLNIYTSASEKIEKFLSNLYEENLDWLLEIQDAAQKAFGSGKITLLPKTPSLKRKRQVIKGTTVVTAVEHASTFVDGSISKKLKIDDISKIDEESLPQNSELNESKRSSRLRNRKKKSSLPVRKSKRNTAQQKNSIIDSSFKIPKQCESIIVKDTPSPQLGAKQSVCSPFSPNVLESSRVSVHDVSHTVQPRVAALIEQLKNSTQKSNVHFDYHKDAKDVVSCLNFSDNEDDDIRDIEISINLPESNKRCEQQEILSNTLENTEQECSKTYTCDDIKEHLTIQDSTFTYQAADVDNTSNRQRDSRDDSDIIMASPEQKIDNKKDKNAMEEQLSFEGNSPDERKSFNIPAVNQVINKIKVVGKELPSKSTPNKIDNENNSNPIFSAVENEPALSKGPKILKPVKAGVNIITNVQSFVKPTENSKINYDEGIKHGNIVTGIKSFVKRADSPKRETEEERQRKKAAELKKKEALRKKNLDEQNLKKQKQLEERKKLREEREKRFAEQKAKLQEEEDLKKEQMEYKLQQASKTKEEIRKQRELQEQKKREVRELKKAEAEHRRLKEEEEHRKKAIDQIEEERRRAEMMQRKAEYEEQERHRKRVENEKAEKERLRVIEEDRILYEERKMREFEEKEQHRLQVDKKLKEEREHERLERALQQERMRKAEKEIEEGKKRENEREKAKEKLREEIKLNIKQEKELKGNQYNSKVLINAHNNKAKNSPLNAVGKENFKSPGVGIASSIKSPAAYHPKHKKTGYNPPKVPLMIRESIYTSYGIDDLGSDDSTDDESEPTKRIPSWAQGSNLKIQLHTQFYTNINPDDIFINCNHPCSLADIFKKKKERYFKRTSSAHWTSPILRK